MMKRQWHDPWSIAVSTRVTIFITPSTLLLFVIVSHPILFLPSVLIPHDVRYVVPFACLGLLCVSLLLMMLTIRYSVCFLVACRPLLRRASPR